MMKGGNGNEEGMHDIFGFDPNVIRTQIYPGVSAEQEARYRADVLNRFLDYHSSFNDINIQGTGVFSVPDKNFDVKDPIQRDDIL